MQEIETQNLANDPEKVAELPHAEVEEEAADAMSKNISKEIDEAVLKGDKRRVKPFPETSYSLSPIGVTKASHEESKKKRKSAARSRRINRGK